MKLRSASVVFCLLVSIASIQGLPAAGKARPAARTVRARGLSLKVGGPIAQGNLTVFPVYPRTLPTTRPMGDYLTLGEALKEGLITVKELPDAEVSRVAVTNNGSKPIYLMAGDIILGGQQDREVSQDTIVPKDARDFVVQVFCVEQGRWHGSRHFGAGEIASNSLRLETQRTKAQDRVWSKVAQENARMNVASPTSAYLATVAGAGTQKSVDGYVKKLSQKLSRDRLAVGLVAAVNGKVVAADVFADNRLFQQQREKMLKSYALDAIQQKDGWTKKARQLQPRITEATALLKDAERGQMKSVSSSSTRNSERENESTVAFDAAPAPAGLAAPPAHRSVYRKK